MTKVEKILKEASALPLDQRLTLVHRLLISTEPAALDEVDSAWDLEIRQRIERYDRGLSSSRPANDVFADLDRRMRS
jgi:hypothetical protein